MSFLRDIYSKNIQINKQQICYWEDYFNKLKSLDFTAYSEKLKIPALIPIGSKILFRGELIHTNEVIVALGADYFVKCSTKQADIIRRHRISDVESKLSLLVKEKEYIENQLFFNHNEINEQEIMEPYNEEDDKIWRKKHKDNIRKHIQSKKQRFSEMCNDTTTDEQLWDRLDVLELEEDLKNELVQNTETSLMKTLFLNNNTEKNDSKPNTNVENKSLAHFVDEINNINNDNKCQSSVQNILNKALDKQEELEIKLQELKNRDRNVSKTKNDVILRMDELEELDELEDEINRLDNILNLNPLKKDNETKHKLKERVSFIADEDNETMELTFSHSNTEPDLQPYNPNKGIVKPSDFYEVFKVANKPKQAISILKKSKYDNKTEPKIEESNTNNYYSQLMNNERNTIVINDVTEKATTNMNEVESISRPPSLFKMKRKTIIKNK